MEKESTLRYNLIKGFGETLWIICPVCGNAMKTTMWEDGTVDDECRCCDRRERELGYIDPYFN